MVDIIDHSIYYVVYHRVNPTIETYVQLFSGSAAFNQCPTYNHVNCFSNCGHECWNEICKSKFLHSSNLVISQIFFRYTQVRLNTNIFCERILKNVIHSLFTTAWSAFEYILYPVKLHWSVGKLYVFPVLLSLSKQLLTISFSWIVSE